MDGYGRKGVRGAVILLLAVGLSGCAGGNGQGPAADTATSEEPFPTPTTEDQAPTTQAQPPANQTPAVSLPSLPIGGSSAPDPTDPARQCVGVSWIVTTDAHPDIPQGYAVEVTGALFSAHGYQVIRSGCGTEGPNCFGYVLRIGHERCDLAVRTLPAARPDAGATVGLRGILYCPKQVGVQRCQKFAGEVAKEPGVTIGLIEPITAAQTGTSSLTSGSG